MSAKWKCNDCGHECNELCENGVTEEQTYCPMCCSANVSLQDKRKWT